MTKKAKPKKPPPPPERDPADCKFVADNVCSHVIADLTHAAVDAGDWHGVFCLAIEAMDRTENEGHSEWCNCDVIRHIYNLVLEAEMAQAPPKAEMN